MLTGYPELANLSLSPSSQVSLDCVKLTTKTKHFPNKVSLGLVVHDCNFSSQRQKHKDQGFEIILRYTKSDRGQPGLHKT